jgi:hypothetical protein
MTVSISVVLPLHQGAAFIDAALASVAAQTLAPLEILVIDDASTDDGPQRARAYAQVRVERAAARGSAAARALGVNQARGARIAFLDQDDLWAPRHLERLSAALDQRGAAFAFGRGLPFTGAAPALRDRGDRIIEVDPWLNLPSCEVLTPSCALVDRAPLIAALGGWPASAPIHDLAAWLGLTRSRPALKVQIDVGYRQHPASTALALRRDPLALLAAHVSTVETAMAALAPPRRAQVATRLALLKALAAFDSIAPEPLAHLAAAFDAAPAAIDAALSHAHWLWGPHWRAAQQAPIHALLDAWPRHRCAARVRAGILDWLPATAFARRVPKESLLALSGSIRRRILRRFVHD